MQISKVNSMQNYNYRKNNPLVFKGRIEQVDFMKFVEKGLNEIAEKANIEKNNKPITEHFQNVFKELKTHFTQKGYKISDNTLENSHNKEIEIVKSVKGIEDEHITISLRKRQEGPDELRYTETQLQNGNFLGYTEGKTNTYNNIVYFDKSSSQNPFKFLLKRLRGFGVQDFQWMSTNKHYEGQSLYSYYSEIFDIAKGRFSNRTKLETIID